jgi:ATP-dependent 26S proteasome regulatory subunit
MKKDIDKITIENDLNRWQKNNEHYLSAALNWLRLRLKYLAESIETQKEKGSSKREIVNTAEMAEAVSHLTAAETVEPTPALLILARRFGLSRFELEVLLLCAAMELDTRMPSLCARAQGDANRQYPTFALAMALFEQPAWDILSPERPLRYWRLIEVNSPGTQTLIGTPLRADERIVNYIKGLNYLDERLTPLLIPLDMPAQFREIPLPPSQHEVVMTIVQRLKSTLPRGVPPVIQLVGPDTVSKQLVARQAAYELGYYLNRLPVELLPGQPLDLEIFIRLWQRESFLLPFALYLDAHEIGGGEISNFTQPLYRFLARSQGIFFISTRELRSDLAFFTAAIDIKKPTIPEQQEVWRAALGEAAEPHSPALLAGQFNLNVVDIRQVVKHAAAEPGRSNGLIPHDRLWASCLANTGPKLDMLAQRLEPKATWDDIVLSQETIGLLRRIAHQVRQRVTVYDTWGFRKKMNRGLGINALFTGDSGTGKTMAAEVIANELHLHLYCIDLSSVVSKYIGETEKNLRRLFDAAEDGGAILFFDEADALFGKRSEVKDSHDRYANIEINYLLQRMETYNGLAILATNMRSALDEAFVRRLRFIVNFPFPGLNERKLILQKVFPPGVPRGDLDYDRLARLNLAGGSIHNIAINAAFMAAEAGEPVTMPMVLAAARSEFRKMERPIKETDFLWQKPGEVVS